MKARQRTSIDFQCLAAVSLPLFSFSWFSLTSRWCPNRLGMLVKQKRIKSLNTLRIVVADSKSACARRRMSSVALAVGDFDVLLFAFLVIAQVTSRTEHFELPSNHEFRFYSSCSHCAHQALETAHRSADRHLLLQLLQRFGRQLVNVQAFLLALSWAFLLRRRCCGWRARLQVNILHRQIISIRNKPAARLSHFAEVEQARCILFQRGEERGITARKQ